MLTEHKIQALQTREINKTPKAQSQIFASLILYEDNHLILLYKPHGIPTQTDQSRDPSLLDFGRSYLIEHYQKPGAAYLSAPHRLDRPAAGLCVLAKTTKAMQRLSRAFQQKQVQKLYLAIVEGRLPQRTRIGRNWRSTYARKPPKINRTFAGLRHRTPSWRSYNIALSHRANATALCSCKPKRAATTRFAANLPAWGTQFGGIKNILQKKSQIFVELSFMPLRWHFRCLCTKNLAREARGIANGPIPNRTI